MFEDKKLALNDFVYLKRKKFVILHDYVFIKFKEVHLKSDEDTTV